MMSTRTGVRALVMVTLCYGALEIVGLLLLLLRPIVHDTSKTAKITCFILVLHWAMDVIYDFYYIHGPMAY